MDLRITDPRPLVSDAPQLKYAGNENVRLLYRMPGYSDTNGQSDWIEVIGDPDNGAYEWVIRRGGKITEHSDAGYGSTLVAMRDGLAAYEHGPDVALIQDMTKCLRLFVQADDYCGTSKRHREKIESQGGECDDGDSWLAQAYEQMHAIVTKLNDRDLWA